MRTAAVILPDASESRRLAVVIEELSRTVETLSSKVDMLLKNGANKSIDGWMDEHELRRITSFSRTQVFKMRRDGRLVGVPVAGKKLFYRRDCIKKLLEEKEKTLLNELMP